MMNDNTPANNRPALAPSTKGAFARYEVITANATHEHRLQRYPVGCLWYRRSTRAHGRERQQKTCARVACSRTHARVFRKNMQKCSDGRRPVEMKNTAQ